MEQILSNITACIDTYDGLPDKLTFNDCDILSGLLKTLSSNLFYLEKYRDTYKRKHDAAFYKNFDQGTGKAKVLADIEVPELYMLRRTMEAAYRCQDAIRSNISYLKQEK